MKKFYLVLIRDGLWVRSDSLKLVAATLHPRCLIECNEEPKVIGVSRFKILQGNYSKYEIPMVSSTRGFCKFLEQNLKKQ